MRYEEWLKSEEYKLENAIGIFATHLVVFIFGFFILGCCSYFLTQREGVVSSVLLLAIIGPIYFSILKNGGRLSFKLFFESVKVLSEHYTAFSFFTTAVSVFLFLKFGLETMIPFWALLALYTVIPGVVVYSLRKNKRFNKFTIGTAVVPFALGLALTINYYISFAPVIETYSYDSVGGYSYGSYKNPPTYRQIILEDNAYSNYPGIMIFHGGRKTHQYNQIKYTFKRGVFGFRIMADFNLETRN